MSIPQGLLDHIDRLDPLPITARRLMESLGTGDANITTISGIIEYDPAIAANILRLANSSMYAGFAPVARLGDAVMRLGTSTVVTFALDEGLRAFRTEAPHYELTEDDLWLHGAAASLAIDELARESRTGENFEFASIGALVHDIGKLIIVRHLNVEIDTFLARIRHDRISIVEAEREVLGCCHGEIGGAVVRKWNFPETICRAVELHHRLPVLDPDPTLDAVMLANLAAKTVGTGLGAEGMNFEVDLEAPRRIGLDSYGFDRVALRTAARLKGLKSAYGISMVRGPNAKAA
jgi:HD-like signal output (HDOD) protein